MVRPLFLLPILCFLAGSLLGQSSSELEPEISANEMRGSANFSIADSLFVEIELHAGDSAGTMAEWWIVAAAGDMFFYFDAIATGT